jgi:hypothetical protein
MPNGSPARQLAPALVALDGAVRTTSTAGSRWRPRLHRAARAQPADERRARRRLDRLETADVRGEHERLKATGGIDLDPEPIQVPGAPLMFMLRDPDGNHVVVVERPADA